MMTMKQYEELKTGDVLFSNERDDICLVHSHVSGWYVRDMLYNEDVQDYEPAPGHDYLLTMNEIRRFYK